MSRAGQTEELVELTASDGPAGDTALRAALAIAACTRQTIEMIWPAESEGLSAEGVAAIQLAAAISRAKSDGATLGSHRIRFAPKGVAAGKFNIDVEKANVAPLLEMAAIPLALAGGPSQLRITGVTHAPGRRTFHDAVFGWLPLSERLGIAAELSLVEAGFEADGGGVVEARIFPAPRLNGIDLGSRGLLVETHAFALAANVGIGIALPLQNRLQNRLRLKGISAQVELMPLPAERAKGVAAAVLAQFERVRVAFVATGRAGLSPEAVADQAVEGLENLLARRGAIPGGTAEAILPALALAASPHGAPGAIGREGPNSSRIATSEVIGGLLTSANVLRKLLPIEIQIVGMPGDDGVVEVRRQSP